MVQVSDRYRQLATDNGRHVYCRIEVGGEVFLDDRLLGFTFDDVTQPDWYTIGTTCANRLHFSAKFDGTIEVGAEVRAYISFDNEEWCSLGIFYVSRRYVRGDTVNITAYDRMYSLDTEYTTALSFPTNSAAILEEICATHGIDLPDSGYAYPVSRQPLSCTVRDMIGFVAGLNSACAKIDREGRLLLKSCRSWGTEHISYLNCMDIQRNMTKSVVTCVKAQTDSEELVSGDGAEISTIEMYNPLVTQKQLDDICALFKPFSFYGADIEMQGLPYLESGECILLLDGALTYPIVISEIEFRYDGALTATIYSRNKTLADVPVYMDDLEQAFEDLKITVPAPITQYDILSDTSVKCNSRTYTVEYGDDGIISQIKDDVGGKLKPAVHSVPSDITMHNAMLWAVVMARGLIALDEVEPLRLYNFNGVPGFNTNYSYDTSYYGYTVSNTLKTYGYDTSRDNAGVYFSMSSIANDDSKTRRFAFSVPVYNIGYKKLRISCSSVWCSANFNYSGIVVGNTYNKANIANSTCGIGDVKLIKYFAQEKTGYTVTDPTGTAVPNGYSIAEPYYEFDISDTIGSEIYIGLMAANYTLNVYEIALI